MSVFPNFPSVELTISQDSHGDSQRVPDVRDVLVAILDCLWEVRNCLGDIQKWLRDSRADTVGQGSEGDGSDEETLVTSEKSGSDDELVAASDS